ncbi:MAG: Uma2 family endonuclease [Xanthomonadales bacterium]|jgi:Uma2 family endonuclease|nr:Uma2 family endonuclease [Xanthomonadales bacterium]
MNTAHKLASYEDVLAAPDTVVAELIHGALYQMPRPAPKHAHATLAVGSLLSPPFGRGRGGPGDWVFLIEPELHLGPHVLVPDLAAWRRERLPELPAEAHIDVAPDWVCEVLSPSTARHDRSVKMPVYAAERVAFAWLIDVQAQTLEAYERDERGRWVLLQTFAGSDTVYPPPFHALPFALQELWSV